MPLDYAAGYCGETTVRSFLKRVERNILNRECAKEEGYYGLRMTWMRRSFHPSCFK